MYATGEATLEALVSTGAEVYGVGITAGVVLAAWVMVQPDVFVSVGSIESHQGSTYHPGSW